MPFSEELSCPITFEPMTDAVVSVCGHTFSEAGLRLYLEGQKKRKERFACPTCRKYVDPKGLRPVLLVREMAEALARQ